MNRLLICLTGSLLLTAAAAAAVTPKGGVALLESLERGMWQLRPTGSGETATKICLGKPDTLLQLRHSGLACEQYVVRSTADTVTVSYTCKGQGQGLTTIRKESNRIVHIQSQGIRDNAPFSVSLEGRKIGPC